MHINGFGLIYLLINKKKFNNQKKRKVGGVNFLFDLVYAIHYIFKL